MSGPRVDGADVRRRRGRRAARAERKAAAARAATTPLGPTITADDELASTRDLQIEEVPASSPPAADPTVTASPGRANDATDPQLPPLDIPITAADAGGSTTGGPSTPAAAARAAATDAWERVEARSSAVVQSGVKRFKRKRKPFWVLIWRTLAKAWQDRILGLSAEAGFWQLLSLPPLLLAIFGALGYAGEALGRDVAVSIEQSLLDAARHILTPDTVTQSVQPVVEEVLASGRPDVISIGFLLSIWSGSTAMSTYVNTITIAYGEREERSAVRSRLLALRLYFAQVLTGVVLLPALVLGPTLIDRLLENRVDTWVQKAVAYTYWPLVAVLSLTILTSLYHLSVPHRRPWRRALPGSILALLIWLAGCYLLRGYVTLVVGNTVIYGTLAAPVAVLLFFYITAFAVLLGAEFNATLDAARREREQPPRVT